jgi:Zn-finger nucleic acid-binding protein
MTCPWCEMDLILAADAAEDGECPQCLTHWRYEDEEEVQIALAA